MSRYKQMIESIFLESDFIDQLRNTFGVTNNMQDGGLILPTGELIHVFDSGVGSLYDKVNADDKTTASNSLYILDRDNGFEENVLDNNIIMYSLAHTLQPNYIILPSTDLTKEQKEVVQEIIRHCGEKGIFIIYNGYSEFSSIRANTESSLEAILSKIENEKNEVEEAKKEYKSKKVFDKDSGYNISKDEEYIFDKLKLRYPNIQKSYTDDRFVNPETHRHFQIDFYDKDTDTAYNLNKHIKHGRRKYNPDDPNCQSDVKWLEKQDGEFYEKILHTWKDLDPLKREVAKNNGLKFIEWFNLDEFNKWYENPKLTYEQYKYSPDSMQYNSKEYFDQKARGRDIYGNDSDPFAP